MPPEDAVTQATSLGPKVASLAAKMLELDPGALARLRRMDVCGPGELEFWKLVTAVDLPGDGKTLRLVKILATLAPKGESASRRSFHDFERPLGAALCDAGLSEARLARFLALPVQQRGEALERWARFLAAQNTGALNCADFAYLLFSSDVRPVRRLAEAYYRQLDRKKAQEEGDSE